MTNQFGEHGAVRFRRSLHLAVLAFILLAMVAVGPSATAQAPPRNGAGLVVRHGDGTLVYAYVEFDEETISGEELLLRSGLDLVVAPYGGLGTGVCAINGEGCPADDCYCKSYGNPAYYWIYFTRTSDGWTKHPRGPTSRQLADGDIDGWSWTAGDPGLPDVTIDEIASLTGFDRSPDPTATALPISTATPTEVTIPSPPTVPAPPSTPIPASNPTETETSTPSTVKPTPTIPLATSSPTPTQAQAPPTSTSPPPPVLTATVTRPAVEPTAALTATAVPSSTATASTGAVVIRPGATPEALEPVSSDGGADQRTLMLFGGFVTLIGTAGAVAVLRRRRSDQ